RRQGGVGAGRVAATESERSERSETDQYGALSDDRVNAAGGPAGISADSKSGRRTIAGQLSGCTLRNGARAAGDGSLRPFGRHDVFHLYAARSRRPHHHWAPGDEQSSLSVGRETTTGTDRSGGRALPG